MPTDNRSVLLFNRPTHPDGWFVEASVFHSEHAYKLRVAKYELLPDDVRRYPVGPDGAVIETVFEGHFKQSRLDGFAVNAQVIVRANALASKVV